MLKIPMSGSFYMYMRTNKQYYTSYACRLLKTDSEAEELPAGSR